MTAACNLCGRNPRAVNNAVSECSVADCRHRRNPWLDDEPIYIAPVREEHPLDRLFDTQENE